MPPGLNEEIKARTLAGEFEELRRLRKELHDSMSALESKLYPVLRPAPILKEPGASALAAPEAVADTRLNELHDENEHLRRLGLRFEGLLARLDV